MDGFNVEEDEEAAGREEVEILGMNCHLQQGLTRRQVLFMNTLVILRGILHHPIEPPWRKTLSSLQLRLQQEKSMRTMLERAMGRASSTLSPGHRHFAAETKELIAEIELLEEEVANREQHVLTLYRSIFEQCVSRPPSEQSSSMASPAHTKNESRKHPSIISSAFCSSKKFPLRPFQVLTSMNDKGKKTSMLQSKSKHASLLNHEQNQKAMRDKHHQNIHPNLMEYTEMTWIKVPECTKVHEKLPTMDRSMLRTLKDHLYQCPSKLSEEMVRCMAAVYCWLRGAASVNPEKNRSPLLSRSSTNVILPRRGIEEDREWSCKSVVEISWISTDKSQFSRASYAINNYRVLVEQLEKVNVSQMESNAQTAFWVNVYNSLVMHAYLAYGIPHSSIRRLALFHKAAYNIGGYIVSANAIEQSIFCFRTPRIGRWLETILSTAMRKKSGEERQLISSKFGLPSSQPLVCFALMYLELFLTPWLFQWGMGSEGEKYCGWGCDIQHNTSTSTSSLALAFSLQFLPPRLPVPAPLNKTRIALEVKESVSTKVLERFAKEASISSDDLLKWVTENVDKKLHDSIQKCIDHKTNKKASQFIEWLPYNSRFRYVFTRDLTEKPWWMKQPGTQTSILQM
ncbi:hypothetical protein CK203_074529 [Vitis vinifera]|uniref:DUF547 domain-containing protein n=1 Tax=Vitis vinifera TaxID=29760 RepID=A0A438ES23_VITVI|nr:hypothetical protein CK203_074529 [Vitis vinifera]